MGVREGWGDTSFVLFASAACLMQTRCTSAGESCIGPDMYKKRPSVKVTPSISRRRAGCAWKRKENSTLALNMSGPWSVRYVPPCSPHFLVCFLVVTGNWQRMFRGAESVPFVIAVRDAIAASRIPLLAEAADCSCFSLPKAFLSPLLITKAVNHYLICDGGGSF